MRPFGTMWVSSNRALTVRPPTIKISGISRQGSREGTDLLDTGPSHQPHGGRAVFTRRAIDAPIALALAAIVSAAILHPVAVTVHAADESPRPAVPPLNTSAPTAWVEVNHPLSTSKADLSKGVQTGVQANQPYMHY